MSSGLSWSTAAIARTIGTTDPTVISLFVAELDDGDSVFTLTQHDELGEIRSDADGEVILSVCDPEAEVRRILETHDPRHHQ